jgi:NAD(P)-dependent dehydrogenase (short-subunit alcohol dehydrogenase family)
MTPTSLAIYPSLKGRIAFITGGATGIGAGLVEAFCRQGTQVAFVDLKKDEGLALCEKMEQVTGIRPLFIECDLRDVEALRQAIEQTRQALGDISILINNAANDKRTNIQDVTPESWDEQMSVNLRPSFFAAQAVQKQMQRLGYGSIINFGSICWSMKQGQMQAYAACKAAMAGLTRSLARDLGADNIRVNTLVPGWVMTDRQLEYYVDEATEEWVTQSQCIKRRLLPEHVADMALFLASDSSAMISAQNFVVDGGLV